MLAARLDPSSPPPRRLRRDAAKRGARLFDRGVKLPARGLRDFRVVNADRDHAMTTTPRPSILLAAVAAPAEGRTHASRIRALYDALRAGDLPAVLSRLAPGVEWEEDRGGPGLPIRRRHMGRGEVARLLADARGFPRGLELVDLVESGNEVAVLAAEGSMPEPGGVAPLRLEAHLWTLDSRGLVTRFRQIAGPAAAPTVH